MTGVVLRALGWDHPRCMSAMRACASAWEQLGRARVEWSTRSLTAFGDEPLERVAGNYDLLVIDHPFCGTAARASILCPLDELLPAADLAALEAAAVGPSQRSYVYEDRTWALASDAACQVSAFSRDLPEDEAPSTWPEAIELMRSLNRRAAVPLSPAHAISSLLTLWAGAGLDPLGDGRLVADETRGLEALEWLSEMHALGHPAAIDWEPPAALAALASGEIDYVPLAYGYVNYARGQGAETRCRFADIPGIAGAVLGGAGLAVSAACPRPAEAAAFAAWACSEQTQREIVSRNEGQPASEACWDDPRLDLEAGGFYSATRATIESAWVRPREPWFPRLQLAAGEAITAGLRGRVPPNRLLARLIDIHHQIATRSSETT